MLKKVINDFKINVCNLYSLLATIGGIWLIFFITSVVFAILKPEKPYHNMGIILAMILGIVFALLFSFASQAIGFNLAVSMGQTRKNYIICTEITTFAYNLIALVFVAVLALLDRGLAGMILKARISDADTIQITPTVLLAGVGICLAMACISLFTAAAAIRFGKKMFYFLWIMYFGCLLFGSTVLDVIKAADRNSFWGGIVFGLADSFTKLGLGGIICLAAALVLVLGVVGAGLLRRAVIK